jgi:hypothetical protein
MMIKFSCFPTKVSHFSKNIEIVVETTNARWEWWVEGKRLYNGRSKQTFSVDFEC